MSSNWERYAIGILLSCLPLVTTGCGSSVAEAPPPATTTITGRAVKGPISNALVAAYRMDALGNSAGEAIGSTTTDTNGDYTLKIPIGSGPVIIVVRGTDTSTYVNEANPTASPVRFTSNETLRAAVIDPAAVTSVPVTPFTDMEVTKLQDFAAAAPAGTPIATLNTAATNSIESAIKILVGAPNFSISDASTASSTAALTLFAQLLTTQSAADPTINSTTLAQNFVNAVTVGGNTLTTLNTQLSDAADALQAKGVTITPTAIPVITPPDFTDTTPPTPPTNLNKTAAYNEVVLSWSASTDATGVAGYFVFRDGIKIATVSVPGYTDATVNAVTTYVYSVRAYDANGNISDPGTLSVTTPAAPAPGSLDIIVNGQIRS